MKTSYEVVFKDDMFQYKCDLLSSVLKVSTKDIKKIYKILKQLDVIYELVKKSNSNNIIYSGFTIIFDGYKCIKIEKVSNWLMIEDEVPIIKKELRKYIKECDAECIKDIIIKIKSLKKGSSNRIKEELK